MEEAPRGTFQDELEWCISQLENGLLRLNPIPEQAEESQRILRVLCSRKAPSVKKRQVMHRVFGDYRLKMAEERKRAAKAAAASEKVQIQPGDAFGSDGVVYRKQSGQHSEASSWFAPSDNNFQFSFHLPETTPEEINRTTEEASKVVVSREQSVGNTPSTRKSQQETLRFSTDVQGPGFAFSFVIPGVVSPPSAADPSVEDAAEAATGRESPSRKAMGTPEISASPKPRRSDAGNGDQRGDGDPSPEVAQEAVTEKKETTDKEMNAAAGGSSKRKKRKKQPSKVEPSKNVNEESRLHVKAASDQAEVGQPDEQMKREVDWCVEQLELGLKTRKSTPKQMGEALRAIKILRSEKAVLAKKRQIMRLTFGDYRKKMAEERQKQLTLMQAASKAARITEVTGDACRRSSRAFRKSVKVAGRSQNAEDSPLHFTRTADACSFRFSPSQEEFQFNFF